MVSISQKHLTFLDLSGCTVHFPILRRGGHRDLGEYSNSHRVTPLEGFHHFSMPKTGQANFRLSHKRAITPFKVHFQGRNIGLYWPQGRLFFFNVWVTVWDLGLPLSFQTAKMPKWFRCNHTKCKPVLSISCTVVHTVLNTCAGDHSSCVIHLFKLSCRHTKWSYQCVMHSTRR